MSNIIKTKQLLTEEYYVEKVSLAMQNDHIFMTQIHDCLRIMKNFANEIDEFNFALSSLLYDIIISENPSINTYIYSDLLDKIASIFNLSRHFVIDFKDPATNIVDEVAKGRFNTFNANVAYNTLSTTVDLTNNQLRLLIYCTIMKNSYDGSYEMIEKTYATACKMIKTEIDDDWAIYQKTDYQLDGQTILANAAFANCILDYQSYEFSADDSQEKRKLSQYFTLFFSGLMTIKSLGIYYYMNVTKARNTLFWAPGVTPSMTGVTDQMYWDYYEDTDHVQHARNWL